jgi:hypothetical protein
LRIVCPPKLGSEVLKNAQPLWANLLIIGESRYRVSSSSVDVDAAWGKICAQVLDEAHSGAPVIEMETALRRRI